MTTRIDPTAAPTVAPVSAPPATAPKPPILRPLYDLQGRTGPERARAHQANVRIRWGDADAYGRHWKAYLEGARRCATSAELRAYGRPAKPQSGLEASSTVAEDADLDRPWQRQLSTYLHGCDELSQLIARLEGRPVPLEAWFEADLAATVHLGGRHAGFAIGREDGHTTASIRGGGANDAAADIRTRDRIEVAREVRLPGVVAMRVDERPGRLEIDAARIGPGAAYVATDGRSVAAGLKVGAHAGFAKATLGVHVKVGVKLNLVDPGTIARGLSGLDYFERE